MSSKAWWQKNTRYMQFNLQLKDTPKMDSDAIAREAAEMGTRALIMNAAGTAAWYPTGVRFEAMNEYMDGRDLVREMIDACHRHGLKYIARMDFFVGAPEEVYHQKPQWFVRDPDGSPLLIGGRRPGRWPLLYGMCANGGYLGEEVAVSLFGELAARYPDIDGFFLCGGFGVPCWCGNCRRKYQERYGKPLPENVDDFEPDWLSSIGSACMEKYYKAIKRSLPNAPLIRYYWSFGSCRNQRHLLSTKRDFANLTLDSYYDVLCTESQDILSVGTERLIPWNATTLAMKSKRYLNCEVPPVGIIHTCPGMDWRHVGMPRAEYLFWAAQVPANGGSLYASLTGVPDTNRDKRMLAYVSDLFHMVERVEPDMDGAVSAAKALLLCDDGRNSQGWTDALMAAHIEFDIMTHTQLTAERLAPYAVVIAAKGFRYPQGCGSMLQGYAEAGGNLIVEGTTEEALAEVKDMLGVNGYLTESEPQEAAYVRMEPTNGGLWRALDGTELVPLSGRVCFCEPAEGTQTLITWVPPFAQVTGAGRPPEFASLPAEHTNVPLCILHAQGKGRVMFVGMELASLLHRYQMTDHYLLAGALIRHMLGDAQRVTVEAPMGVLSTVFEKDGNVLVHLVNGVGKAPLKETVPVTNCRVGVKLAEGGKVRRVYAAISGRELSFAMDGDIAIAALDVLNTWEMLRFELD